MSWPEETVAVNRIDKRRLIHIGKWHLASTQGEPYPEQRCAVVS